MTLKDAAWKKHRSADLPTVDYPEVSKDYPLATVLPHATKSSLRLNYSMIALATVLALTLIGSLFGAGIFDRFITH